MNHIASPDLFLIAEPKISIKFLIFTKRSFELTVKQLTTNAINVSL